MKRLSLFILSTIILSYVCSAQSISRHSSRLYSSRIDKIHTAKEIDKFILKYKPSYKGLHIQAINSKDEPEKKRIADSLGVKMVAKADFDGNGRTDMLVTGVYSNYFVLCIMDLGHDNYKILPITRRSFQEVTYPVVRRINDRDMILYYEQKDKTGRYRQEAQYELSVDTLVYYIDDFVEREQPVNAIKVEKIEFKTTSCFGSCPVFSIEIDANQNAAYYADQFNKDVKTGKYIKGLFHTVLDNAHYKNLVDALSYINLPKLYDFYAVSWTDDQTSILKVTYDCGEQKTITDYGMIGTFGLQLIYKMLTELRDNQEWKKK